MKSVASHLSFAFFEPCGALDKVFLILESEKPFNENYVRIILLYNII